MSRADHTPPHNYIISAQKVVGAEKHSTLVKNTASGAAVGMLPKCAAVGAIDTAEASQAKWLKITEARRWADIFTGGVFRTINPRRLLLC
jgi:hypothetical protein